MMEKHRKDLLSAYLDGELPADERGGMQKHLSACSDCSRNLDFLRQVRSGLSQIAVKPMPQSLYDRLLAIPKESAPASSFKFERFWLPVGALAFAAALLAILWLGLRRQGLQDSPASNPALMADQTKPDTDIASSDESQNGEDSSANQPAEDTTSVSNDN